MPKPAPKATNLSGMFESVNNQVGEIATSVGMTPANFSPGVFAMVRNISESVIIPIAGLILTFIAPFDIQEVRDVTAYDELQLDTLGDKKTALFLIMSDTDATFNFLISMIYTQLFNLLCEKAPEL